MRNGTKLRHLLSVCDIYLTMDDEGKINLTTTAKSGQGSRRKEGATFSAVLDKAYRQMLKDAGRGMEEGEAE